jgi:hypothetical protein
MELFLSLFFGISVISILYLLNQACSVSLTEAVSLNIIKLRRGENTDISEVFDVKCAKCYACPQELISFSPSFPSLRGGSRTATDAAISRDAIRTSLHAICSSRLPVIARNEMTKQSQVLQSAFQDSQPRHL